MRNRYSDRDKKEALEALDADLAADDVTAEEYAREEARIHAGSPRSKYLPDSRGLGERAMAGDRQAMWTIGVRIAIIFGLFILAIVVVGVVLGMTGTEFDGGYVPDADGD